MELNVEHHGEDIVPNMTRSTRVKYITFYEDSESIPGRRTAVWELDKGVLHIYKLCMKRVMSVYYSSLTLIMPL